MKYDFTRCNNLNFKVKDNGGKVREGYLKVSSNGYVYLYYSGENKIFNPYLQVEYNSYHLIFTDTMNFHEWAERHELEIIPRDPETLQHTQLSGLYPCGEGAGYSGGIVSSALDGINCAERIANGR